MRQKQALKAIRDKYGRPQVIKRDKDHRQRLSSRYAEENITCGLSILHNANRNQEWARRLKGEIGLCSLGIYLDL